MDMSPSQVDRLHVADIETPAFGATWRDGLATFRLWAPRQDTVDLVIEGRLPLAMPRRPGGWFELAVITPPGVRYLYRLGNGRLVPDPASHYQPADVHGPSELISDDAFAWTDAGWTGVPWPEAVIYELHVGTFTPEGSFRAAADRLAYLRSLGVTVVELMPVSAFPGRWSWGYDGVMPFATDSHYGRPDDLKALVDKAHSLGLAVLLDVVYNHFGPEGNYLPELAPAMTDAHTTPWGDALDFSPAGDGAMRRFVLDNVRRWIADFHFDGLRIDAAHEIRDDSEPHILDEIAAVARAAGAGRCIHLVLESARREGKRIGADTFTAQWNDHVHHGLHAAVTGECHRDYSRHNGHPELLARALAEGFTVGSIDGGEEEPEAMPPAAFVAFLQNHDQIGNRPRGDRVGGLSVPAARRAASAVVLLSPQVPLLFQGEEWAASAPFPFFADLSPAFAEPVRQGRAAAFADQCGTPPDPFDPATFASARLDWSERLRHGHAAVLDWHRAILRVRRKEIVPMLASIERRVAHRVEDEVIRVVWEGDDRTLTLIANLSPDPAPVEDVPTGRVIWQEGRIRDGFCSPWHVGWTVRRRRD